jgi:hypothetical protein
MAWFKLPACGVQHDLDFVDLPRRERQGFAVRLAVDQIEYPLTPPLQKCTIHKNHTIFNTGCNHIAFVTTFRRGSIAFRICRRA